MYIYVCVYLSAWTLSRYLEPSATKGNHPASTGRYYNQIKEREDEPVISASDLGRYYQESRNPCIMASEVKASAKDDPLLKEYLDINKYQERLDVLIVPRRGLHRISLKYN